jgi:5-methylcytosine-specific restriction endonuclease McrA
MGKLTNLGPALKALPSRLAYSQNPVAKEQPSSAQPAWYAWKWSRRWKALRKAILLRDRYTCQWPGCGRLHSDTSKLVADHRIPHRGDAKLFWDPENLQTLCANPCHNKHKQRLEAQFPPGHWY